MDAQRQQYEAACRINQAHSLTKITKQQRLISIGCLGKKRRLNAQTNHLNQETALEDLALLEQVHDNFLANLSDDERAKLVASKPIDTQEKSIQSKTPTKAQTTKTHCYP